MQHMEDDEARRFTPSEVLLSQHTQDRRCVVIGHLRST